MTDELDQRCSDDDRDRAVAMLREALSQGRLDRSEFGDRIDAVLAARTHGDLRVVLADIEITGVDSASASHQWLSQLGVGDVRSSGTKFALSIFGSQSFAPRTARTVVVAIFGSSLVDLSGLPATQHRKIVAISLFGSTKIVLGPQQRAHLGGLAVLGSKRLSRRVRSTGPIAVDVTGLTLMGSIAVVGRRR
jgi:hypothetical protein